MKSTPISSGSDSVEKNQLTGKQVLLVDDSPDLRSLLETFLVHLGCVVDAAENGQRAIELAKKRSYDFALIDLMMPGLNGYDTLKELRSCGVSCPVIAITAGSEFNEEYRCLKSGFIGLLVKPFRLSDFKKILLQAFSDGLSEDRREARELEEKEDRVLDLLQVRLAHKFFKQTRIDLAELISAFEKKNFDSVSFISHRISGAAAIFGFQNLSHLARSIQALADKRKIQQCAEALINFEFQFNKEKEKLLK